MTLPLQPSTAEQPDIVARLRAHAGFIENGGCAEHQMTDEPWLLREAADEIERRRDQLLKLHDCAPNALFYQEQAEYWRGIAREDRAEIERLRGAAYTAREAALEKAARDFIAKVDRGDARSFKSYVAFQEALALSSTDREGK